MPRLSHPGCMMLAMNGPHEQRVRKIASRRHGVVTRAEARTAGMSDQMIQTRLHCGLWRRLADGVYAIGEGSGYLTDLAAAVAVLPGAVVSHQSAGRLHRLDWVSQTPLAVTVPSHTTHDFPGVVVHRTSDLRADQVVEVEGLPVTTVARTIIDLAAVLRVERLERVLDEALAARRCKVEDLSRHLAATARRGKPGVRALRPLVAAREGREVPTSLMERLALRAFRSAELPEPICQFPAPWDRHQRVDFAFPDARLIVEVDGRRWHTRYDDFESDRRRDNAAVAAGWRVLRFTWDRLKADPDGICREIARVLAI